MQKHNEKVISTLFCSISKIYRSWHWIGRRVRIWWRLEVQIRRFTHIGLNNETAIFWTTDCTVMKENEWIYIFCNRSDRPKWPWQNAGKYRSLLDKLLPWRVPWKRELWSTKVSTSIWWDQSRKCSNSTRRYSSPVWPANRHSFRISHLDKDQSTLGNKVLLWSIHHRSWRHRSRRCTGWSGQGSPWEPIFSTTFEKLISFSFILTLQF